MRYFIPHFTVDNMLQSALIACDNADGDSVLQCAIIDFKIDSSLKS